MKKILSTILMFFVFTVIGVKAEWKEEGAHKYFLKNNTIVKSEWVLYNKKYYYFDANGKMAKNTWIGDYYLKSDGAMAEKEWVYYKNVYYYTDESGKYVQSKWVLHNSKYYYLDSEGKMAKNTWIGDYYLKSDGAMAEKEWIKDGNNEYYLDGSGKKVVNAWVKDYYLNDRGSKDRNKWILYSGHYYFAGTDGLRVKNRWIVDSGKSYYLKSNGIMAESEWIGDSYVKSSGEKVISDWVLDKGHYYYIDETGKYVHSRWIKHNDKDYYLKEDGKMAKNEWIFDSSYAQHYYLDSTGAWDKTKMYNFTNEDRKTMKGYRLIDISEHNSIIDFSKLKGSIDGVIVRAGWDVNEDKLFRRNMEELEKYNISYGFYWYSYALNEEEAQKEAEKFMEVIKPYNPTFPVYIDMEDADHYKARQGSHHMANTWAGREKIVKLHAEYYLKHGYKAGVYMSKSWFDNMSTDLKKYEGWVAHWDVGTEKYRNSWFGMHQYSDSGRLIGLLGNVDLNIAWIYYPKLKK